MNDNESVLFWFGLFVGLFLAFAIPDWKTTPTDYQAAELTCEHNQGVEFIRIDRFGATMTLVCNNGAEFSNIQRYPKIKEPENAINPILETD